MGLGMGKRGEKSCTVARKLVSLGVVAGAGEEDARPKTARKTSGSLMVKNAKDTKKFQCWGMVDECWME